MPNLLVANIGSTSFKFRLFEMPSERVLARGGVERIGASDAPWSFQAGSGEKTAGTGPFPDYEAAIRWAGDQLAAAGLGSFADLAAVGFKPVMANGISGTQYMDEPVLAAMEDLYSLLPAHNPPYVAAVRAFRHLFPNVPRIGTFETAFYDHLPEYNRRFPVPREWETKYGIRRTGFHGASHRFVTERAAELTGRNDLRIISCHLGGSSSIAAVRHGKAIDSSWGMTPQSGLPQNNRVGDFDVFALIHLLRNCGLDIDTVERQLSKDSGLKGMSGLATGDVRDLLTAAKEGNADAAIALDVFVASVRKYIGQFLVELNGIDVLVFTAGIAEHNPELRAKICADMDFCGLRLDPEANARVRGEEALLSSPDSRIEVRLIPTNEELVIARNAWKLLAESPRP